MYSLWNLDRYRNDCINDFEKCAMIKRLAEKIFLHIMY